MKLLITIFTLGIFSTAFGQDIEFKTSNFKDQKEELKAAKFELDAGMHFFEQGELAVFAVKNAEESFLAALQHFQKAYDFNPNSADLNYKMGVSFAHTSFKEKCIPLIKRAHELNPEVDPFINYYMGVAAQLEGKYAEAINFFNRFETDYRKADLYSKFVKQRKKECESAMTITATSLRVWVDNLEEVNTAYNDFAPSITMDGEELVLTSDRPNSHEPDDIGQYDSDIYTSSYENGKWTTPTTAKGAINSTADDISSCYSYNGTKMLMSKLNASGDFDIYESELHGDTWSVPEGISRNINQKSDDKYASYSSGDIYIYYTKATQGGTNGYDIYISGVMNRAEKKYGTPNKVMNVSSPFNEGPIYLHPDGKTMYFASEGFNSIGGYDIFKCTYESGKWGDPVNMGYPINSPYDDFFFSSSANGKYAYITSNRAGGKGGNDIYKVTFWGEEKTPALSVEDFLLASITEPINDPQLESAVQVTESINLTVFKGKTIDDLSKEAVEAVIEITDNSTGNVIETFTTNSASGKFLLSLNSGKNYGIAVKADGYMFHSENFDIPSGSAYNLVNKTIELKNVKVGNTVTLRNIFFDTGKSLLRQESNAELNRLIKLMNDVPTLRVEISGHTDNTGSSTLNNKLSQARAEAVVAYLTQNGISASRLEAKGYGSTNPIASNNTEQGRQDNRRTEFKIIGN
ncbi:MAG: OmpA family protein [Putridiphycobacter sp.]|nr:OmpA family protein [Putridiphycobacter sp.]